MHRSILHIGFVLALLATAAPLALADEPTRPYRSEMREQCEAERAKDALWTAELKASMRPEIHQDDAVLMLKNKKHVVMAYGALWILTVAFLVLLWLRQRKLVAELDRLEQQIGKAAAE